MARISEAEVNIRKALDLDPLDSFVCESCGFEIPVVSEMDKSKIICGKCNRVIDGSSFSPLIRKQNVWVSEKGMELRFRRHKNPFSKCNCVNNYRKVARFRQAIFETYEKQGEIGLVQAVGMFVAFFTDLEEGVLKLLGRPGSAHKQAWGNKSYEEKPGEFQVFVWNWLDTMQIKTGVGRPARTDNLILFLDAAVLMFCPNHYLHFLRDALMLRSHEYKVQANRATAHQEAWNKFWKAKRAVEVKCKRLWRIWFENNPEPPPSNWWERVAHKQGLMG